MAAKTLLVDSSVYIGLIRMGRDPLSELQVRASEWDLVTCGIVRCEVARGLIHPKLLKAFKDFSDVMTYVPTDNKIWEQVEKLVWELDRKGRMLPLTDVIIACCAMQVEATVLAWDRHFQEIPGLNWTVDLD